MSWCIIALLVTSAISAVTSQPRPDVEIPANNTRGEAVINSMLSGDGVPSSNILNIIGAGDAGGATHTGMAGPAGPMKKFTLPQVQAMVAGMNNGFRYKYDGTVSNNVADTTISKDQLLAMRDQLQGTGSASGTKEFTIDEIRMMIDGINNGLYYNRQGQVTTLESGEPLYTVGDLRDLLSKQEALEQVLQRFTLEDVRRMVQGMESGLRYNHQGMIASEGQNILPLSRLRSHLRTLEALGGSPNRPTDIPIMPGTGGGEPDTGLQSIAQFTLDQVRSMITGMEGGEHYNYQGKRATGREPRLTMQQLQRFLNEILSQGIQQTADFTLADLERMKLGIANGLEYNFQGQMALPGQARLTAGRIDELLAKLAAKGPMGGGSQSTNFTIGDVNRMLRGMDQGYFYNFQGLQATGSEERLTRGYLQRLLNQLSPSKGIGGAMETASFTLEDVNRMLNGMDSGKSYNYDGIEARFGERALTRKQLEQFMADLKRKGMGGMMTTPSFTLEDINRMLTGMDNGLTYNYNGLEALAGEQPLTRKQLNDFKAKLERKGMGGMITTASFTLQDIDRMLTGMNNGLTYNYQGVEAMAGEKPLTRQDLIQFKDDLKRKGMGGMITTPAFTLQDIDRMLTGMNNGLTYNYQGVEAMAGEKPLTRQDLIQFKDDLKRKGMGGMITTPSFTLQDIDRMLTGMNNGLTYNYQGVEAMAGEKPLTRQDLIQFKDDLKRKGMGGELGTASFTMDDIFRMLAGMDNGISYNYQGLEAKKDEKTLTRKQLEKLMTQIRNKGKLGDPTQTAQFTVSDLERMTAGMKQGQKFNYAGLPAAVGDPTLSSHDLDRLLSQLTSSAGLKGSIDGSSTSTSTNESSSGQISGIGEGGKKIEANFSSETSQTDSSSETVITIVSGGGQGSNIIDLNPVVKGGQDILQHPFTAREIRKLMEGIRQGFTYNKQGAIAKQGEEPLTMNELSKYLSNAKTKDETGLEIPASRFTKDEIIRMKDDIKNGQSYNYEGLPAVSGEKILTIQQLDRLLERLSVTGVEPDIPTSRFTRQEINKMINDINRGISYNYYGKTPVGDEKKLTVAVLNKLLRRLDSSGADLDIPISRFTREQILRMIDDINRGTLYNYNGLTPVGNEKTLTVDVLNRLLQRLDGTGGEGGEPLIPASRFTRQEINRMINDINRGISYNYYGKTPIGGEKKLTVAVLNKLLQRLDSSGGEGGEPFIPTSRFTRQEINRMINDINRGIPYNYYGKTPVGGEKKLTVAVLNKLLRRLDGTGGEPDIPISRFTREQIDKMIDDISRGISYNYNGLRPIGNEKTLTVDVLNRLLQRLDGTVGEPDIPTSRFTRQEINRMINDINGGISYNYYGKTPVGGEKTLTVAVLNKLLRRLDGTGGEPDIPISRFTREQINKMIDDINRGISYNYNGLRPIGNEKTLTVDVLNRLLQRLDGTVGEPDIPTSRFTRQEINRMINDINGGISYNYYGKTPVGGEKTLTIAVLNKLLRRLDGTGGEPDIPISRFTREQINKMIDDINRGISYNYNGLRPIGNEKTLTVDVLNRLLQRLDGTVGEPDIPTSRFTRQEINRMINDINGGISYNYYGKTPVGGEKTLTVAVLNKLLRRLDGTGGEPDIPISRFTREQINKMIDDINRGISYNYNGLRPIGNEKTLTVDVLNRLLQRLDGTVGEPDIPTSRFTRQEINRMINDINGGMSYNYYGKTPVGGEKTLTIAVLNKLLRRLDGTGGEPDIPISRFTREQINKMIDDINRGISYNYNGLRPIGNEKTLTVDVLNRLLQRLDGTVGEPDIPTSRFTRQEINRMINDINGGISYNYYGKTPVGGEKTLTVAVLNKLLRRLDGTGGEPDIPISRFTREQINKMIDDINRGISYNYNGLRPIGNEKTLTVDALNRLLQRLDGTVGEPDIPTSRFTRQEINRMINDINGGISYNYYGKTPVGGEKTLTVAVLNKLLRRLDGTGGEPDIPISRFTREQINKMIDDINRGISYNYNGLRPIGNEKTLTVDVLNRLLQRLDGTVGEPDIPTSRFTRQEINRMINDINEGISYNYYGKTPVGGEKTLTVAVLNKLLRRLDGTGVDPDIPISRFTREQINKMIDDINRGLSYNYNGLRPIGNEKTLTVDVLNRLLQRLDGTVGEPDIPTSRFTRQEINRMINDINGGISYNYHGKTPVGGEKTLTVAVLNKLLRRLDGTGGEPDIPISRFTREQIIKMIDDINRGISYNYDGLRPIGNEKTLTVDVLNRLLQRLDGTVGEPDIPTSRFTRQEINRMINDINGGISYNYYGKTPVGGEKTLTVAVLDKLLRRLDGTGVEPDIPISRFTREQINKMIDDINRGISYNYNGLRPIGNEKTLTVDVLYRLLQRLDGTVGEPDIPSSRFTRQEINRMINDINGGISYNYYGKTPVGGEKTLTVAVLNKLLRRLDGTGGEPDIPISRFTREQINKMIDDINRGISYNYNGLRPIGNEKTLTVDVLNRLLQRLDGTVGEPDIPTSRFTRQEINRMINDINRGISYNYYGKTPVGGEKKLTVAVLNKLLRRLDGTGVEPDIPTSRFTRQEINRMINDINRGISYNYYGKTPVGGEKRLTVDVLNRLLQRLDGTVGEADIPTSRFTRQEINRMINDINRGISYNYYGKTPLGGEKTLTVAVLNELLRRFDGTGVEPDIPISRFTREQINKMIDDINRGISYNYNGLRPIGGEKTLTVDVLNRLLQRFDSTVGEPDIPTSRFTRQEINRMINDINRGISYNYYGKTPVGSEKKLTVAVLNRLLRRLDGTAGAPDIPTSRFTRQEINRMISDINRGISYNYYGKTPVGGEKKLTVAILNNLLRKLDGTAGEPDIPTSRFTRQEINRMINDINRGISYNYYGKTPVGGEKKLTVAVLNKLLRRLDGTGMEPDIPTSRFTRQEINRMINDINRGISYNYYGKTPVGGEKKLTVDVLNKLLRRLDGTVGEPDIPTSRFTRQEINRMINDINRGISYNYYGKTPVGGEKKLTVAVLNKLLRTLDGTVGEPDIPTSRFTRQEINRMINDINRGISYNYYGKTPVGSEKKLTVAVLNNLLRRLDGTVGEPDIPTSRFTREEINRMINDINRGISYNYYGKTPVGSEKKLTVAVLNNLLRRLDGTVGEPDIPTSRFTRQEINRMINDINKGISYNYYGKTPVGGEKKLTVDVLNKLLRSLDGTVGEQDIPTSRFTRQEINRMISDINRGISYNYYGKTPVGSEKKLTVAVLNNLLRRLDGTVGEPDIPTSRFTRQEINRMINDINRGISYNYYGKTPVGGEKKLTVAVLNKLLRTLDGTVAVGQPDIPTSRFTRQEINRMINDINRGISYNYYGKTPVGSEKKLTVAVLNNLLRRLDGTVGEPDIPTSRFTRQEINRMINDINRGISYNYYGKTPVGSEKKLTVAVLNKLLRRLDGTGVEPDIPISRFTREQINKMIDDINRGISYNYNGLRPIGGEKTLTVDVLNRLLQRFDSTVGEPDIPTSRFTRQEINRMINDINRGISYNYYGKTPVGGEKKLTVAVLNKLLRRLDGTVGEPDIPTSRFTRQEINRMINDINRGISYNYYGKTPVGSEKKLTVAVLNNLLRRLDGTVGEPDIPTSRFTRQEINRMINDINRGISYNYYGKTPVGGEKKLTVAVLNKLLRTLDGTVGEPDIPTSRFTRQEINRMINDINRGISYNYYGKTPVGSEKKLTVAVLNNLLRRLDGTGGQKRFTLDDINRMLEGLGKGEAYNTEGKTATGGEPTLTIGELKQIGKDLVGATPPQPLDRNFTFDEINRMLDGMDGGKNYNYQGRESGPGEAALTRDQLTRSLVTSLMPNYNIQDVYNMLRGMDTGTLYNYQGNVAAQGDRTWLKDQLQLLLVYLLGLRYENVAENKPAEISSVYDPVWTGDKGVDGNRNQNMFYDSCFHTRFEQDPYFMVDLGAVYDLDTIVVFNRQDCCENRANNLEISTGLSQYNMTVQDVIPDPIGSIGMKRFMQKPSARYVKIQKKDMNPGYLHLCEVEVYGTYNREDICNTSPCLNGGTCTNIPGYLCICATGWTGSRCHISTDNIAYGKRTEMSSLYQYNNMFSGDRGVDGNTSGILEQGVGNTCFHTDKERRPYWKVDLGAVYDLQRIVLHNRLDCCTDRAHDIEILVGLTNDDLTPIYYQPGNLGPMKEINVPYGTEGQFVMIHIKDLRPEYLHLCEVEIYGNFLRKDRCTKNPCRNGGTCTNKAGSAICNCPPGWGGIFCMRDESQTGTTYPTVTDAPEPPHWNGSRVDSAICRRAKCNLPICYLPYANDCKSYVVCQRTAIGTYVAWKMRCAFGSYWGTGTTWTCERVEDLAKRGYTCPNDPCADGTLTRYADQEIKNCRTYWYCENGVSKPACCPPGKRFDEYSLLCVDDPQEICRKPCPLKRDGCAITGARTMPFYDGNCRSYWNCEGGHAHPVCCRSGMSYDVAKGHCKQDPTCTDHCPSEYTAKACGKITKPGERPVQSYALADGNCRTYMKCSDKGYDDPFCCRQNFYYDVTTAKCEIVMNELDVCRSERCPRGYKEECRFTSVEGSPTQFYDTDALVVRDCAPSTHFAPDICTCDGSSLTNECKAEVWTKFDHLDDKWSVKNYGDGWISVFGEMSKNRSDQGVTYGTFDGSSGMEVWRYDHTAFPEATLEITFQPVASGIDKQILVSNCMSVDNGQASFEVSLDPRTSEIVFRGKSKFDSAELRLTYNKQGWNTFKLFFDGDHVVVLIEDPTGRGKTEKKFAYLRGDIVAGVGALKFGPCLDSFSMPQNNGFTGFVSEVLFSKCIDRKSRKFVRDNIVPEKRYGNALN